MVEPAHIEVIRHVAAAIIDMVLDAIEKEHPHIVSILQYSYMDYIENSSILSGTAYYRLEDEITKYLDVIINSEERV